MVHTDLTVFALTVLCPSCHPELPFTSHKRGIAETWRRGFQTASEGSSCHHTPVHEPRNRSSKTNIVEHHCPAFEPFLKPINEGSGKPRAVYLLPSSTSGSISPDRVPLHFAFIRSMAGRYHVFSGCRLGRTHPFPIGTHLSSFPRIILRA